MLEERECKICGVWFQPKRKNNIYCEECSKRSGAKKKKMKRQIMIIPLIAMELRTERAVNGIGH